MPENSWPEENSYNELEPLEGLFNEITLVSEDDFESDFFQGLAGRRRKAALALTLVWGGTFTLHWLPWGYWVAIGFMTLLAIQAARILRAKPKTEPSPLSPDALATAAAQQTLPKVSLVVAAKNEEAVVRNLVQMLCQIEYPAECYEVWVVDDHSTDRTPQILAELKHTYPQLKVLRRGAGATGGKSGALNQVLALTKGDLIGVFDADAQVSPDLLRRVLPLFDRPKVGAVQMRKAIANISPNFWIQGQIAEMALDSYFQQQRIAIGGIGELRGNGQFVRRTALNSCGGWNEETITDDLDLSLRLHLDQWEIDFMLNPVQEEGVTRAKALWHQRNRWAEGGYQRYLDYWRLIASDRLGVRKNLDLFTFFLIQYILPTAGIPDTLFALAFDRPPLLMPVTGLALGLSMFGMWKGLRRTNPQLSPVAAFFQSVRGLIYMLHWFPVIATMSARISVQPKRLKWVKTVHQGSSH